MADVSQLETPLGLWRRALYRWKMGQLRKRAEKFERAYAERSGITVEKLRGMGRVVRPCNCGEEGCEGWQSVSHETAAEIDDPEKPWAR